jgi:hypothetical protein
VWRNGINVVHIVRRELVNPRRELITLMNLKEQVSNLVVVVIPKVVFLVVRTNGVRRISWAYEKILK